ncbi:hypothetical protein [Kitasatospora viridis]|uniref:Terpene synthase n=1 Tax=Kitasatospora viridis TaxID=281105 RepID=A0A561UDE7_9ACTN|nr:hypothetical protein [Kitasatospora viridis]TWF97358.1 hypothetical protein FHX73_111138 [Kitasatospora viridis]
MNPTGHPTLSPHRPPGVDTLRYTGRRGLAAVPDPRHRALVAEVLASGLVDRAIALTDSFDPPVDLAQARADAAALIAEFAAFGVSVPAATARNITLMRAMMVPIADDALALALDRIWVFTTNVDDVCCHDRAEAAAILRGGMLPEAGSPNVRYIRYMFDEVAPFCDPTFLAVFKTYFHTAVAGVLMEAEFTPEAADPVDSDFVRIFNGFSQFWFTSLQFTDPSLRAEDNRGFWAAALSAGVAFLNDVNDVLSFYKEAVHGGDFAVSRIHRQSVAGRVPYLTAYRRAVEGGLAAYRRILALASEEQRPHLERYLTGFAYWHFHCPRYRWQDVYPELTMIEV